MRPIRALRARATIPARAQAASLAESRNAGGSDEYPSAARCSCVLEGTPQLGHRVPGVMAFHRLDLGDIELACHH